MRSTTILIAAAFVFFWNSGFIGAEYGLPYARPFTFLFWRYARATPGYHADGMDGLRGHVAGL